MQKIRNTKGSVIKVLLKKGLKEEFESFEKKIDAKLDTLDRKFDAKLERLENKIDAKLTKFRDTILTAIDPLLAELEHTDGKTESLPHIKLKRSEANLGVTKRESKNWKPRE